MMPGRRFSKLTLLFLIIISAALGLYYSTLPVYCLVDENAWINTSLRYRIPALRIRLFSQKIRLKHITLDLSELGDRQYVEESLTGLQSSELIVLDPVIAFACNMHNIDTSEILKNTCIVAITSDNSKNLFSCILESDEDTAWNSLNLKDNVIICRNEEDISSYLNTSDSELSFVLDFRFADAVPGKFLYGVIEPKLEDAFTVRTGKGVLNYEFRKTQRRIF